MNTTTPAPEEPAPDRPEEPHAPELVLRLITQLAVLSQQIAPRTPVARLRAWIGALFHRPAPVCPQTRLAMMDVLAQLNAIAAEFPPQDAEPAPLPAPLPATPIRRKPPVTLIDGRHPAPRSAAEADPSSPPSLPTPARAPRPILARPIAARPILARPILARPIPAHGTPPAARRPKIVIFSKNGDRCQRTPMSKTFRISNEHGCTVELGEAVGCGQAAGQYTGNWRARSPALSRQRAFSATKRTMQTTSGSPGTYRC